MIDVVLSIAVMVLLVLSISQKRSQVPSESQIPTYEQEKASENLDVKGQFAKKNVSSKQSVKGFTKCIHQFGYLKNLPQNTPVPDECFGCQKVMRCLFPSEQDQITA